MPVIVSETDIENKEKEMSSRQVHNGRRLYPILKRCYDIVFSLFALLLFSPTLLIIALIIVLDDPHAGPLFIQNRVGLNGKEFRMVKFRTMFADAEARRAELEQYNEMDGPVFKIKKDPRITKVGHFLRVTSLDEFPQFLNVLVGDMSIVGPRPALPNEVSAYNEYQKGRLSVLPGITCYWQIQPKRNDLSFGEWIEMDLKYIRERSVAADLRIILQTISAVFRMEGL